MAGVKGRSGRQPWRRERDLQNLWEKSVPLVLRYLENPQVGERAKMEVALEIVKKLCPTQTQVTGEGGGPITVSMIEGLRAVVSRPVFTGAVGSDGPG